jgi:hypothetical protein
MTRIYLKMVVNEDDILSMYVLLMQLFVWSPCSAFVPSVVGCLSERSAFLQGLGPRAVMRMTVCLFLANLVECLSDSG